MYFVCNVYLCVHAYINYIHMNFSSKILSISPYNYELFLTITHKGYLLNYIMNKYIYVMFSLVLKRLFPSFCC